MIFEKRNKLIAKNVLISSLDNTLKKVSRAFLLNDGELNTYKRFYLNAYSADVSMEVLKQDFKYYKVYFKKLKKECIPFEFAFALNDAKNRINSLIKRLNDYTELNDYYLEYKFDYQIVINFIDRYLSFFKHYNSKLLYQYCFDLQKGLFYIDNRYTEQRLEIITETLKSIYFNENYTGNDVGYNLCSSYYGTIYLIKQQDAKHFLEKEFEKDEYKTHTKSILEKKEETLIDYSQSKLTEKILALNEVGVLDFLRNKEPFNFSVNKLSEFLSLCLGEKATSIQSYINAIINKSDQSKSPYNTTKTVEKVKQKLIQIGLKIE
jgi:hypothetical protein